MKPALIRGACSPAMFTVCVALWSAVLAGGHSRAGVPREIVLEERCDLIERNRVWRQGLARPCLEQLIYWDWNPRRGRYEVRDWSPAADVLPCPQGYQTIFTHGGCLRRITAPLYRETDTTADPEILDRQRLPIHERRRLRQHSLTFFVAFLFLRG